MTRRIENVKWRTNCMEKAQRKMFLALTLLPERYPKGFPRRTKAKYRQIRGLIENSMATLAIANEALNKLTKKYGR